MTGLFLILVILVWLAIAIGLAFLVTRWLPKNRWRFLLRLVLFLVFIPLPVADELIGKQQFEDLCKKYAVQEIDKQHAMNRHVMFVRRSGDQFAKGTMVQIRIDPHVYKDAETNQVLVSYSTLHAEGGWFIRTLGISETNAPLLFNSGCAPPDQYAFKKKFNIKVIN